VGNLLLLALGAVSLALGHEPSILVVRVFLLLVHRRLRITSAVTSVLPFRRPASLRLTLRWISHVRERLLRALRLTLSGSGPRGDYHQRLRGPGENIQIGGVKLVDDVVCLLRQLHHVQTPLGLVTVVARSLALRATHILKVLLAELGRSARSRLAALHFILLLGLLKVHIQIWNQRRVCLDVALLHLWPCVKCRCLVLALVNLLLLRIKEKRAKMHSDHVGKGGSQLL